MNSRSAIPVEMEITFLMGLLRRRGRSAVMVLKMPTRFVWMDFWKSEMRRGRFFSLGGVC